MKTEKRDQILKAALELFTAQGFRGTSTAEISQRAGVATGTLFHHFNSKEELINELYLSAKFELADELEAALAGTPTLHEKAKKFWFAFADWAIKNEGKYRFFKHCEASPYISEDLRQEGAARFAFFFEVFEDIAKSREDKNVSTLLLLDLYIGLLDGFIRNLIHNPDIRKDKGQWEAAYSLCYRVIA